MPDQRFIDAALQAHNRHRANHGVPPLRHNKAITAIAQRWADAIARRNCMQHSSQQERVFQGGHMGENIAMSFSSTMEDYTGDAATDQWYEEVERYNYQTSSGPRTGHFTQVVWAGSQEFGIGKAQSKDGAWYVVANYYPAGNFLGRYAENVFPPGTKNAPRPKPAPAPVASQPRGGANGPSEEKIGRVRELKPFDWGASDFGGGGGMASHGTRTHRSTRTETTRGPDGKVVSKTIITETTTEVDGSKHTTTREIIKDGDTTTSNQSSCVHRDDHKPGLLDRIKHRGDKEEKKKSQSMKEFIDEVVKTHNRYRKAHGKVGDVKHNKELDVLAQSWADRLASAGSLSHSTNSYQGKKLGENVASKWGSQGADYTGKDVTDQWYSEESKYDYNTDYQSNTGHFSQVVWKGSKEIGIGKAFGSDGRVFVVANYHPAGNILGRFAENVSPPKK